MHVEIADGLREREGVGGDGALTSSPLRLSTSATA
jgi:hypothetical protein